MLQKYGIFIKEGEKTNDRSCEGQFSRTKVGTRAMRHWSVWRKGELYERYERVHGYGRGI
jgi:hypothetical protein